MSDCEKYSSLFNQILQNTKNEIIYNKINNDDHNINININDKINLKNAKKQHETYHFTNAFSKCLKSYIETNKYTGNINEKTVDSNGIILITTYSQYYNGNEIFLGSNTFF